MRCVVKNCPTDLRRKSEKNIAFFSFPRDEHTLNKWLEFCGRDEFNIKTHRICSEHFTAEDFERNLKFEMGFCTRNQLKLKSGVVPTVKPIVLEQVKIQPPPIENDQSLVLKIENLEKKLKELKQENLILKRNEQRQSSKMISLKGRLNMLLLNKNSIEERLKEIFTEGQVEILKTGTFNRRQWTEDDILKSIELYSASSKVYKFLRKKDFPLPAIRTLQSWAAKINSYL